MSLRVCYSKDKIVEGINNAGALSPEDLKKEMQEFVFTDLFLIVSTNLKSRFHAITYLTQKSLVFLPSPCSAVNLCPTKKIRRRTLANGDKTLKQLMKPMICWWSRSWTFKSIVCLYLGIFHLFHLVTDKKKSKFSE